MHDKTQYYLHFNKIEDEFHRFGNLNLLIPKLEFLMLLAELDQITVGKWGF